MVASVTTLNEDYAHLLFDYASGALDEAQSILVASFITLSPAAREFVTQCESLGGALIQSCCEPVSMREGSLQTLLNRMKEEPDQDGSYPTESVSFPESLPLPMPISQYIKFGSDQKLKWKKAFQGFKYYMLPLRSREHRVMLIKMDPGASVPPHNHNGTELTLVLEGSFSDGNGKYERGDLVVYDEHSKHHRPVADEKIGCLCLAVTSAPIQFENGFAKLLNPLMRWVH